MGGAANIGAVNRQSVSVRTEVRSVGMWRVSSETVVRLGCGKKVSSVGLAVPRWKRGKPKNSASVVPILRTERERMGQPTVSVMSTMSIERVGHPPFGSGRHIGTILGCCIDDCRFLRVLHERLSRWFRMTSPFEKNAGISHNAQDVAKIRLAAKTEVGYHPRPSNAEVRIGFSFPSLYSSFL